jgi:hypothetical protein
LPNFKLGFAAPRIQPWLTPIMVMPTVEDAISWIPGAPR